MKKQFKWIWYALWLIIALVGGGGTLFSWMPRTDAMFYGGCAMLIVAAITGIMLFLMTKGKKFTQTILPACVGGVVYTGALAAVVYLCDEVIYKNAINNYQPIHSSFTVVVLNFVLIVAMCIAVPKIYDAKLLWLKRGISLILCCVALALSALPQNFWWVEWNFVQETMSTERLNAPSGLSNFKEKEYPLVENADFYVAVDGNDANGGSFVAPFATLERAKEAVRAMDKTGKSQVVVAVKAGEYIFDSIKFTTEDSGTKDCPIIYCAYGDGDVILNAGVSLKIEDFAVVSGEQAERLDESVRDKVVCVDLKKYGITAEDYGNMHAVGTGNTAYKYDGDYVGSSNCELFVNDVRQTISRWPNDEYLKTDKVIEHGQPKETVDNPNVTVEGWDELRNPNGDTYSLSKELADHVNSWKTTEDVWMYGYWSYDWAPASTPIESFDYEKRAIKNKFVSIYGARENMPYYFFNVFEEIDAPGEWYLDRETGILYMYQPENFADAEIMMSLSEATMVTMEDADYLTMRGFTLCGSRGNGVEVVGDNNTIEACLIKNISGTGVRAIGYNNLISSNEITRTGIGGVYVEGGDFETLTSGNNRVYNNHIHHWGELDGVHGIQVRGVGQQIDHNEMHDYIDVAINYYGNNHIIEYNLIYDVSLETSDGGAIYCGRSWTMYGNVIRYNCIYNVGDGSFSLPNGIYVDDGLSGQQVYGNILVNIPADGIKVGGGHDNEVWGNIIINAKRPLHGVGSLYQQNIDETLLPEWENSFKDTDAWKSAYPVMQQLFYDTSKSDDPYFIANPARNNVNGNICINNDGNIGVIDEQIANYSNWDGNAVYKMDMLEQIFVDPDNGDYSIKEDAPIYDIIPDFEEIPYDKIGRE